MTKPIQCRVFELELRMKDLEDNILWLNRATNYCGCTDKLCKAEQTESQTQEWLNARKLPFDTGPVLKDAKPTPTDEELVRKFCVELSAWRIGDNDKILPEILRQLIKEVRS